MKAITTGLRSPALISFILVLPFMALEALLNPANAGGALDFFLLFGVLWLLPLVFIVILAPVVRNGRAGISIMANPLNLLLRVVFLALIATMWGGILLDQLPCFLGVPNCD